MTRSPRFFVLLISALALLPACGPALQSTPQPVALAPTATSAPTIAPTVAPEPTAAPVPVPTVVDTTTRLDTLFTDQAAKGFFSGTVLIRQGEEVLLRKGYGLADQATGTPNTPTTVYRIGNITQPLTAFGILLLEAQDKLSTQDSLCTYLDDCPAAWKPLTLHHLLSNTSGIPNYWVKNRTTALDPMDLVALVRERPLVFTPGSKWDTALSQTNHVLLGLVIERVSGKPYETFMDEQIFRPLEMSATGYKGQPVDLATGYRSRKDLAEPFDASVAYAAYGLYSTVDDLYRWNQALYTDELLPAAQREAMLTSYSHPFDDPKMGYSYGALVSDDYLSGHQLVAPGMPFSSYPGFWATTWNLTDLDITVVILANRQYGPLEDPFSDTVASILLEQP